jgi:hypothetical protein
MKFKVGDEIIVVNCSEGKDNGKKGVIENDHESGSIPYLIRLDDGSNNWFNESEIELIEEPKGKTLEQIKKDYSYPVKDIRLDKLKQLIKAVNTLGEFGKQVELKITIELDGKKVEL